MPNDDESHRDNRDRRDRRHRRHGDRPSRGRRSRDQQGGEGPAMDPRQPDYWRGRSPGQTVGRYLREHSPDPETYADQEQTILQDVGTAAHAYVAARDQYQQVFRENPYGTEYNQFMGTYANYAAESWRSAQAHGYVESDILPYVGGENLTPLQQTIRQHYDIPPEPSPAGNYGVRPDSRPPSDAETAALTSAWTRPWTPTPPGTTTPEGTPISSRPPSRSSSPTRR